MSGRTVEDGALASAVASPRAGAREWIGLAVLALPCLLYAMDLTVLNLAVPSISADLKPSSTELLWIVDIYGFMVAGSLVTMGTLGDRIGRRRLLLFGAVAFGAASVLAAFSTSAEMLIATRALLGLAGATIAPSTLSLISNMFLDAGQRTFAIGVWIASYSAGAAIGPPLGGLLLEYFWWGSVFLLAVPVMVLLLALGPRLLPEFRAPHAGRLDPPSVALSMVGILPLIYGIKQFAEHGVGLLAALSILVGLVAIVAFVRRQGSLGDPLIDLRLFRAPAFSAALATYTLSIFVTFGSFLFVAQYLQLVIGLSPMQAGLWSMPGALAFLVGSMLTPLLARRARPAFVMAGGLLFSALGFGLLTQAVGESALPILVTGEVVLSLGLAPVFTLATDIILGTAPPERSGAASAISETGAELGGALGIAMLGSIGTAVYRGQVASAIPAGVPPEAAETARDTLGGAVAMAAQLPDHLGAALLEVARGAFVSGLQVAATTSAVGVTALAILVLVLLRHVRSGTGPEGGHPSAEPASAGERADPQLVLARGEQRQ